MTDAARGENHLQSDFSIRLEIPVGLAGLCVECPATVREAFDEREVFTNKGFWSRVWIAGFGKSEMNRRGYVVRPQTGN